MSVVAAAPAESQVAQAPSMFPEETEEELGERMGRTVYGAMTTLMLTVGDQLGIFPALRDLGPSTPEQLAKHVNLHERWVRELLFQQAAARFVSTDETASKFWLTPAQVNVLANEKHSPAFMLGCPAGVHVFFSKVKDIAGCFKTGCGLRYDAFGTDCACGAHRELGVWMRHNLIPSIRALPELTQKLEEGVQVADVGCGCGLGLMLLAREFPKSTFSGYDTSRAALSIANKHLEEEALPNLTFHNPDDGPEHSLPSQPTFTLVMVNDALHDMARPDLCLKAIHTALLKEAPASLIIGDIKGLGPPANNIKDHPMAGLMYGYSVSVCMSSGLSEPGGLGLGTLGFHEAVARRMVTEAGFSRFTNLDWPSQMNAYYIAAP